MTTPDPTPVADQVAPRWQDPTLPTAERVELVLEQMTLEEKVAQLGSRWIGGGLPDAGADAGPAPAADGDANHTVAPMQEVFAAGRALSLEDQLKIAWFTQVFGTDVHDRFPRLRMINWFEWRKEEPEVGAVIDWRLSASGELGRSLLEGVPAGWLRFAGD